jgi:flagellar biosynthetic protein FlhB
LRSLLPTTLQLVEKFVRPLMIALACFAAVDVLLVRFQHTKSMRMTREQVRLEMRDTDGDPHVKAKLKRIREMRSRRRMMAKVKSAAVVITNPTHFAVALSYDNTGAPRVVAKGADFIAARIREEAEVHKIPIVANPPLARALYEVELDREIPGEHYRAVAEVIAFVWKLKTRRSVSGIRL